jgi:hypothetical protein
MVSASLGLIETELKRLATVEIVKLKALDDRSFLPCDLLVITAGYIEPDAFSQWVQGVETRLAKQAGITVPSVIYASVPESIQRGLLRWAVESNWYFDIIDPDHVSSLPIRVANFLRIHDHLHEIRRMNEQLQTLSEKAQNFEAQLDERLKNALDDAP